MAQIVNSLASIPTSTLLNAAVGCAVLEQVVRKTVNILNQVSPRFAPLVNRWVDFPQIMIMNALVQKQDEKLSIAVGSLGFNAFAKLFEQSSTSDILDHVGRLTVKVASFSTSFVLFCRATSTCEKVVHGVRTVILFQYFVRDALRTKEYFDRQGLSVQRGDWFGFNAWKAEQEYWV